MSLQHMSSGGGAGRRPSVWLGFALALLVASPSFASHFRFGHISWTSRSDVGPNAVDFSVQTVWRRSAFRSNNNRCINPATLAPKPCTGPNATAGVGDIIHERQGGSRLNPGDSSGLIGGPGSLDDALLFLVTSIDATNDWLYGTALDPDSLPQASPPFDTAISHTYSSAGNRTAHLTDCCRASACDGVNAHMNNPDNQYRVETRVNAGSGKSSPVTSLPPIVLCPQNGLCQFSIPVSDNDLDPVSFRLSTNGESGISSHPGSPQCPNAAAVHSSTGQYTWNTTGCRLASNPGPQPPSGGCNNPNGNTLYSTQVMVEEPPGGSRVAVDFFIQLVSSCEFGNTAPVFESPTPVCGSTLSVNPGNPLSFSVQASDPDSGDLVQLNATGLPSGALMSPSLPISGQPVGSGFSWTPTAQQEGQHVIAFSATDGCSGQTLCSVTIDVSNEVCDDGVDNDGDSLADCADPDCNDTACDDGLFCTDSDSCSAGACVGTPRTCGDGNGCTIDSCDEGADSCVHDAAAANGNSCEDGQYCTVGDTCSGGACGSGPARDCSVFGGSCSTGACNEALDQCEPEPANEGAACDDLSYCTTGEICSGGTCAGGTLRSCSDGNSCTSDVCDDGADQCVNDPLGGCCGNGAIESGEVCDDGNQADGDGCDADCTLSTECLFASADGNEWFVGGCGSPNFATVQAAIDAAGDVISICPGVYVGAVAVTKELALRSTTDAESTEVRAVGTTIDIRRSRVSIEGLTIVSETGAAVEANAICPPGQSSCGSPGGSSVRIADNIIRDSVAGIRWSSPISCVEIAANELLDNASPISLVQAGGPPAVMVMIGGEAGGVARGNLVRNGGSGGVSVEVAGMEVSVIANEIEDAELDGLVVRDVTTRTVTIAANAIRRSGRHGISVGQLAAGSSVVENQVDANAGDGVRVMPGAGEAIVRLNNITGNGVGLGNEATTGVLDARRNWWRSQTGPSGLYPGVGDSIENRAAATTSFIEFLCRPFPEGFDSVDGICSAETAELRQLVPGRRPDIAQKGRYVAFESAANLDVDTRSSMGNTDGGQEVFLLDRRPRSRWGGVCMGGLTPCDFDNIQSCVPCASNKDCPGDHSADPFVLNGECVVITQLTDDSTGDATSGFPRITAGGKEVMCSTNADLMSSNPDGSLEVMSWRRKLHERGGPLVPQSMLTDGPWGVNSSAPAPSVNGSVVALESNADPVGQNPDGNTEIFLHYPRKNIWVQVTRTTSFCSVSGEDCESDDDCEGPGDSCTAVENRRPATIDGRRIVFESTGDLHNDPRRPGVNNPDHNREIFIAKVQKTGSTLVTQVTSSLSPVENSGPTGDSRAKLVAFSSNGDYAGTNADGSREIFVWSASRSTTEQLTTASAGESINPVMSTTGRWLVFESTSDLEQNGASNRRVFQFDRDLGELTALSRLRFGTNQQPRMRRRRFVIWESTANLTGNNAQGDWVVFVFDRKKD